VPAWKATEINWTEISVQFSSVASTGA